MSRTPLTRSAVGACVAGLLLAGRAWAETGDDAGQGLHLSWVRLADAAACADARWIEADVQRRLAGSLVEDAGAFDASVEAVVVRTETGWRASIVVRRTDGTLLGQRDVESQATTCDSLARASALSIALMLGAADTTPAEPAEARPPRPSEPMAPPSAPALAAPPSDTGTSDDPSRGFGLVAGVVCGVGLLPGRACGGAVRNEITLAEHFSAALGVYFLPEQPLARAGANVDFGLMFTTLGGCHRFAVVEPLVWSTCAALALGVLHVGVESPTPVAPGERMWWALSTGVRLGWRHGALQLQGGIDALVPLDRHEYVVERPGSGSARVFVDPDLGAAATLGAGVWF